MENLTERDLLTIYYGGDYKISDYITIHQPSVLDIVLLGESKFWDMVTKLCGNPTMYRLPLWEIGKDWNEMSDYDLFVLLYMGLETEQTNIIFGDLDFKKFKPVETEEGKIILVYMPDPVIQIDEEIYTRMVDYLRMAFDFKPKVEKAANKATKENIIFEEQLNRMNAERLKNKQGDSTPFLSMISFALNHPGFKYKKDELSKVGIFEFMDSLTRLQNTESVTALMHGMYSGFLDTKKIDLKTELNLMKDLHTTKKK